MPRRVPYSLPAETDVKVAGNSANSVTNSSVHQPGSSPSPSSSPPLSAAALGPQAIPRRHAPAEALARQGSFRGFPALSQKTSPFKRQLSLRMNELPSTMQRKSDFPIKNTGEDLRRLTGDLQEESDKVWSGVLALWILFLQSLRWKEKVTASVPCALRSLPPSVDPPRTRSLPLRCLNQRPPHSPLWHQVKPDHTEHLLSAVPDALTNIPF